MLATALDNLLAHRAARAPAATVADQRAMATPFGTLRVRDTGGRGPVVLMAPDGPNLIEHHADVIALLAPHARVICFDMPGFGFSRPARRYAHTLGQGAGAILAVMDALDVREAALLLSCANGFYGIAAARQAPQRIRRFVLAQTPGFSAMPAWTQRNVPGPLRAPMLGQALNRIARRKLAHAWYGIAMPDRTRRAQFRATAADALAHGACFCLAGVVQGLGRATAAELAGVRQPATLLWGDADRSHQHTQAESLHELLPQARIRHLPECGHFPELEQPEVYVEEVLATAA